MGSGNPRFNSVMVNCDYCNKEFYQQNYLIRDGKGNYCSRVCASRNTAKARSEKRKTGQDVPCYFCGTVIYRVHSAIRKHNFCSQQCLGEYKKSKRITITCAFCGIKKKVKPSYAQKAKCCSLECAIKYSGENNLETLGYALLDTMGFNYIKQYKLGGFIPDAYIASIGMVVLFDGDYWHNKAEHIDRDNRFNAYATKVGVKVVRVLESELKHSYSILRDRIIRVSGLLPSQVPPIPESFVPPINRNGVLQLPLIPLTSR